jgi:hypothetical protein
MRDLGRGWGGKDMWTEGTEPCRLSMLTFSSSMVAESVVLGVERVWAKGEEVLGEVSCARITLVKT